MTAFLEKRRIYFVSFLFLYNKCIIFYFYIDKKEGNGYNICIMGRGILRVFAPK